MTIDSKSWGFRGNAPLSDYMTIKELIETLAETVRYLLLQGRLISIIYALEKHMQIWLPPAIWIQFLSVVNRSQDIVILNICTSKCS